MSNQLLGDEVRVEPMSLELLVAEECGDCLLTDCESCVALYTCPADGRKPDGT